MVIDNTETKVNYKNVVQHTHTAIKHVYMFKTLPIDNFSYIVRCILIVLKQKG